MAESVKCCGKGCENRGVPEPGFDFYLCADCAGELEFWLEFFGRQRSQDGSERN